MGRRCVIVATGARTPVGLRAPTSAAAVRAGICRHGFHPTLRDGAGEPLRFALDARLDPDVQGTARMEAIALWAMRESIEPLMAVGRVPFSLWVALPEERPGWSPTDATAVMRTLASDVARWCEPEQVTSVPRGHAAGLVALELALRELSTGSSRACVIGGVDSYLHDATIDWLDDSRQLCTTTNRSGFVPGEAAGFFVITTEATARTWGLPEMAAIHGVGSSIEPNAIKSGRTCTGEGLTAAIREATRGLRLPEEKITTTFCDINGERYRSEEFLYVPLRCPTPFVDANRYEAPADSWGDVGAASGPLFVTLAAASGQSQRIYARDGRCMLAWTGSEGGTRAAVTLILPERKHEWQ
jgi:3-oxoacyl-[acyl-carrier-protein] synthase I